MDVPPVEEIFHTDFAAGTDPRRGGAQQIPRPPNTKRGTPPPWAGATQHERSPAMPLIAERLRSTRPPTASPVEALTNRASAVLAPIYEHEDDTWIILTRRAWHLRSHAGEVSLPGGGQEDDDATLWDTAVRESQEEIGLDPDLPMQVAELDHLSTVTSRSFIVPYVGLLAERPVLQRNANEVDAIVHVRLNELLEAGVYRQERWGILGLDRPIHYFELVGDTVWGATGSILVDLLSRVTGRDSA